MRRVELWGVELWEGGVVEGWSWGGRVELWGGWKWRGKDEDGIKIGDGRVGEMEVEYGGLLVHVNL